MTHTEKPTATELPTPREIIAAANYLGDEIVAEIVGRGGLSGATAEQLIELVNYARNVG